MARTLFLLLSILSLPALAAAQRSLSFQELPACEYLMRIHPSGTHLVSSHEPQLEPWLPARQYGWLITQDSTFQRFFQAVDQGFPPIDYKRYFVLAMIRYDEYPWKFITEKINWLPRTIDIEITYTLSPVGRKHKDPVLSTQLILVEKSPEILRLGIENLCFSLVEKLDIDDPDILIYGQNPEELIFPRAYSLEEIMAIKDSLP